MSPTGVEQGLRSMTASQVCLACKSRKRKCDKKIPRCSYCEHKNIDCCYDYGAVSDTPPPSIKECFNKNIWIPTIKNSPDCLCDTDDHSLQQSSTKSTPSGSVEQTFDLAAFDTTLSLEVDAIIRASHQSIDDIEKRYFRGLSLWVPFLCPVRFRKDIVQHRMAATADFSLLLLCMSLNTYDPPQHCTPPIGHDILYLQAKTFFAQLQVLQRVSLATIKAGIFISTYEYAHGRPDDALASIDICARMAYKIGIHQKPERPEQSEAWSTWWALRIFERTFYCESTFNNLPFITSAPDESEPLPHQNGEAVCEDSPSWTSNITPANLMQVDCLGRAAQAACLLDRVFHTIKSVATNDQISTLVLIDSELQRLLSATMNKCHGERGGHCGAVGISIRALFILHQHIARLNTISIGLEWRRHSQAALDSAAQMVIDIARSHRIIHGADVDIISPVCNYVVRHALQHIYEKRYADSNAWFRDTDTLRQSLDKMNRRWLVEMGPPSGCQDVSQPCKWPQKLQ